MVATVGFCCCRRSSELWAFESMAGRLPLTSHRAVSLSVSAGLKPLSSFRVRNFSTSLAEEQRVASRCALFSDLGTVASGRAFYTDGGGKGRSLLSKGGRLNGTAAHAYDQNGQQERAESPSPAQAQEQNGQQQQESGELPRPPLIYWEKDLANAIQLIGHVGRDIVVKYLDNGKAVVHTSLVAKKGLNRNEEPTWFELEIWDSLAEIAGNYVEKGELIFVTGRIVLDRRVKDEVSYTNVKVVVRDFCFVEPNNGRQPYVQEQAANSPNSQWSWSRQQSSNQPSQGTEGQKGASNRESIQQPN